VTRLAPSSPNPFRHTATISFSLAQRGPVELLLYSVDGRRVRTLAQGVREPGEYRLVWDGRDDNGNPMSAGVYYAHLVTAQGRLTRTMTHLK
jgi:flagellar hook assembly protein FlgD